MIKTGLRSSGPRIFAFFSVVVVQGPNSYILHNLKVPFAWNFFDELNSTEPLNCKTSECYSVPLGHFLKMRQFKMVHFSGDFHSEKVLMSSNTVKLYIVG